MRSSLFLLVAINVFLAAVEASPNAAPDASPAAFPQPAPKALPEATTDALEEASAEEEALEKKNGSKCPTCPAVLGAALAPFANVTLAQDYCSAFQNGTLSSNPTCQNFGSLLVKSPQLFCCCLWPMTNGTPNATHSGGGRSPRDLDSGNGIFRRMWRAVTGQSDAKAITLVNGMPVEKSFSRIGGGSSIRRHGIALSLETAEGVALKLEVPDVSLPEAQVLDK